MQSEYLDSLLNEDIYPCTEQKGLCRVHSILPPQLHSCLS